MRTSRSFQSGAVQVTELPAATVATSAQVLAANPSATVRSIHNTSLGAMFVYLCDLEAKDAGQPLSYQVPTKATWEDPANYTGAITVEFELNDGAAVCSEWV